VLVVISLLAVLSIYEAELAFGTGHFAVVAVTLAVGWFLYLVIIEYLPRRRVLKVRREVVFGRLYLFTVIYYLFSPFMWLYGIIFSHLRKTGISEDQKEDIIERAIETLADQAGVDEDLVEEDEKEMIGQIFLLDVTEVREVMVPRIDMIGIKNGSTLDEIRQLTHEHGFSRYPVFDENIDKILGVLYIKDLFTDFSAGPDSFDITKFMRRPYFVSEKKIISELLAEFKANKVHIAIVIDEYGGTSGLVTLEDILEEIVGEIQDEHDSETAPMTRLSDNSYRIDAGLSVEELVDELNLEYETGEFETVGGLIYDLVGSVPAPGTIVKWRDVLFEVDKVDGQRITSVKAWLKKGSEP